MRENPYPGINAHLNSLLQTVGRVGQPAIWPAFHSRHVSHIADGLTESLPQRYIAISEQALQTRSIDIGEIGIHYSEPDVTIFQRAPSPASIGVATLPAANWELPLTVTLEEPLKPPNAVVIHELLAQGKIGRIVARIELLSPSNKPGGADYRAYARKRFEALRTGVPLIEIDYLHESRSPVLKLPAYPQDVNSAPYAITVSDPRPTWEEGRARTYNFHVGEPVRTFPLPLADEDVVLVDMDAIYQHTFRTGRWGDLLDYSAEPERMETYGAADQAAIRAVMAKLTA
jgi:hypothetical protein